MASPEAAEPPDTAGGEPDLHGLLGLGKRRAGGASDHGEQDGEHPRETSHANPPWRVMTRVESISRLCPAVPRRHWRVSGPI